MKLISRLKAHINLLMPRASFAHSVGVLVGGTAIAQVLGVLALPVLTRIYTPEQYGILGSFCALLGVISVISALRYQIAIPLPKSDDEAVNLLVISCVFVLAISLITLFAVYFFSDILIAKFTTAGIGEVLWMLPMGVFLTGSYSVFNMWATRKKSYVYIAQTRIEQTVSGVGAQLILGWTGIGAVGLVIGQVISNGMGFFGLARRAWVDVKKQLKIITCESLLGAASKYRRFPFYSTPEAICNTAGVEIPLLVVAYTAGNKELGFLMLVMRILQAPMSLIGSAVGQVFYGNAIAKFSDGSLMNFTIATLRRLFLLGALPILITTILGSISAPYILGNEWNRVGTLIGWLAPFFFFQFLASPLSMVLHVVNQQKISLMLQIFGLLLRCGSILVYSDFPSEVFAVSSAIFYLIYLLVILGAVKFTPSR